MILLLPSIRLTINRVRLAIKYCLGQPNLLHLLRYLSLCIKTALTASLDQVHWYTIIAHVEEVWPFSWIQFYLPRNSASEPADATVQGAKPIIPVKILPYYLILACSYLLWEKIATDSLSLNDLFLIKKVCRRRTRLVCVSTKLIVSTWNLGNTCYSLSCFYSAR